MTNPLRAVAAIAVSLFLLGGGGLALLVWMDPFDTRKDWKRQQDIKHQLLSAKPSRKEVLEMLGACIDYSRGTTNEATLKALLDREPQNWGLVRERAKKWPGVLHATTSHVQTWVFLDEADRVADVVLMSQ